MKRRILVSAFFDFFVNFNDRTTYIICKKSNVKDTHNIYDGVKLLKKNGFVNNREELTEKGRLLQEQCIELNKLLR